jgi:hypothetical protein
MHLGGGMSLVCTVRKEGACENVRGKLNAPGTKQVGGGQECGIAGMCRTIVRLVGEVLQCALAAVALYIQEQALGAAPGMTVVVCVFWGRGCRPLRRSCMPEHPA